MSGKYDARLSKRALVSYFSLVVLFFICALALVSVNGAGYSETASEMNGYTVKLSRIRGNFFDRNLNLITGTKSSITAVTVPTETAVAAMSAELSEDEKTRVMNDLENGKVSAAAVKNKINCDGVKCIEITKHISEDTPCRHLIGYLDGDGHGVYGLERVFDDELYTDKWISVRYAANGKGELLSGVEGEIISDSGALQSGIVLTIDGNVQAAAENAANLLKKGAVVVADVQSGEILAAVSRPDFDIDDIGQSLDNKDNPFVNRILSAYNVGSVFKPCVAAALIESKNGGFTYECTGSAEIGGHTFNCHNLSGHGKVNLGTALMFSCNTFFYNASLKAGADTLYSYASAFGFGRSETLCRGVKTAGENLPSEKTLSADEKALANFSIGQGELLASPVKMLNLYCAIANDGTYRKPSLIYGKMKNGILTEKSKETERIRVMSADAAALIRKYLTGVTSEGTGKRASPERVSAAGKTATAETGKKISGENVVNTWFCGFFPAEEPRYAAVVLSENSDTSAEPTAEVFKSIADALY